MNKTRYFCKIREKDGHMSNFYPCDINIVQFGLFKTSEHLYQALKYFDHNMEYFRQIQNSKSAWEAAKLGRDKTFLFRKDWDQVKIDAMRFTVMHKYLQNNDIAKLLLETEDDILVEYAPHGDVFWGVNSEYVGQNWLGVVLMEVREILKLCLIDKTNTYAEDYLKEAIKTLGL